MKIKYHLIYTMAGLAVALSCLLSSCKYEQIAKTSYPDQQLYLAAAIDGFYNANAINNTDSIPTPGNTTRYVVDAAAGKVIIPIGVLRGGINYDGNVTVNINSAADSVSRLISNGKLTGTLQLPATAYSIPQSVQLPNGVSTRPFNILLDLAYLKSNPKKKFAVAVTISSTNVKVNAALSTAVIIFDTTSLTP